MATSDLHGNLEGLNPQGADVVVLAGDIAPLRGRGPWHINDQKKWINKKFREWTESYPDIQFVVIPGNHDFYPIAHILFKEQGSVGQIMPVLQLGQDVQRLQIIQVQVTEWRRLPS